MLLPQKASESYAQHYSSPFGPTFWNPNLLETNSCLCQQSAAQEADVIHTEVQHSVTTLDDLQQALISMNTCDWQGDAGSYFHQSIQALISYVDSVVEELNVTYSLA